ncbi:MAG: hypothetical protein JSW05_09465 [Candidatus Thorarchaeota archaeon]|nr:MAG: hypothetical protein JSW05_09465 [Candidatus Thorarchaeota archaeon]
MYMTLVVILLVIVSFAMALVWRRRARRFTELLLYLTARFDPDTMDLSGRKHYSGCLSHGWAMEHLTQGSHSKISRSFQELIAEKTLEATLALASLVGILPMIVAYLALGGLAATGGSILVAVVAFFLVQAPLDVGLSYGLLSWLMEQDPFQLKVGDFAFAHVSSKAMDTWFKILIVAGVISMVLAPMSDGMLESAAYGIAALFGFLLTHVFAPIAVLNPGVAYVIFVALVASISTSILIVPETVYRLIKGSQDILALDAKDYADQSEEKTIGK